MAVTTDWNAQPMRPGAAVGVPMDGATQTIYRHTLVMNDATGYAVSGLDTAACIFRGVAAQRVTLTTEADGTSEVMVHKTGEFLFAFGAGNAAITTVGTAVFITDNNTVDVAGTTTNDVPCGRVSRYVSATRVYVNIDGYAI